MKSQSNPTLESKESKIDASLLNEFSARAEDEGKANLTWKEGWNLPGVSLALKQMAVLYEKTHALSNSAKQEITKIKEIASQLYAQKSLITEEQMTALEAWKKSSAKEIFMHYGLSSEGGGGGHSEYARIQQIVRTGKYHLTIYNAGFESINTDKNRHLTKGIREIEIDLDKVILPQSDLTEIEKNFPGIANAEKRKKLIEDKKMEQFINLLVLRQTSENIKEREAIEKELESCLGKEVRSNQSREQYRGNCTVFSMMQMLQDTLSSDVYHSFHQFFSDPAQVADSINQIEMIQKLLSAAVPIQGKDQDIYKFMNDNKNNKAQVNTIYIIGSVPGTLLSHAVRLGYNEVATAQLKLGANPCQSMQGTTSPLLLAIRNGNTPLVKQMIEKWDVKSLQTPNQGMTPLMEAIHQGHWDIVKMLATKGISFSFKDNNNFRPCREMLIQLNNIKDYATRCETAQLFKPIFSEIINHLDNDQQRKEFITELNQRIKMNNFNETFFSRLHLIPFLSSVDLSLTKLLELLPDNDKSAILKSEQNKLSPLWYAVENGDAAAVKYLVEIGNAKELNSMDVNGNSLLNVAISKRNMDVLKELFKSNVLDVNAVDRVGSPLHKAVLVNNAEILALVLSQNKLDINKQNKAGSTALHFAVESSEQICKLLLDAKPNLTIKDKYGFTPSQMEDISPKNKKLLAKHVDEIAKQDEAKRVVSQSSMFKPKTTEVPTAVEDSLKKSHSDKPRQ